MAEVLGHFTSHHAQLRNPYVDHDVICGLHVLSSVLQGREAEPATRRRGGEAARQRGGEVRQRCARHSNVERIILKSV